MLKRVAVLCSHRAPGLLYLLNRAADRGVAYDIVCVVSSEQTFEEEVRVERRGIPTRAHPIRSFNGSREAYDAATLKILEPFMPDLILLDGYVYLITEPLLTAYRSRIINLHFSDLTLRTPTGAPKFPGLHAVRDSIVAGCHETRATVHLVDEVPDGGPPIVRSWPFPVSPLIESIRTLNAPDAFKAYVYAHQQWMMRTASGPLINAALRLIATGQVEHGPWMLDQHGFLLAPEVEYA